MSRPPRLGPLPVRIELGVFAFAPAMGLLAARARHEGLWWLAFAIPAVVGCVIALVAGVVVWRGNPEPFSFLDIDDAGDDVLGHVGSYLLPVVVDVSGSIENVVIAGTALALTVHIHIATGRVHVNPLLYVLGYRTYRATTVSGVAYYLIAHTDPSEWNDERLLVQLAPSVLVEGRPGSKGSGATSGTGR